MKKIHEMFKRIKFAKLTFFHGYQYYFFYRKKNTEIVCPLPSPSSQPGVPKTPGVRDRVNTDNILIYKQNMKLILEFDTFP